MQTSADFALQMLYLMALLALPQLLISEVSRNNGHQKMQMPVAMSAYVCYEML